MAIEDAFNSFKAFDIGNASLSFWVFKRSSSDPTGFTARSVLLTNNLENELKTLIFEFGVGLTEFESYGLLAQPTESGVLGLSLEGSKFQQLKGLVDRPVEEWYFTNNKQLLNAVGYIVRLRQGAQVLYFVKKADATWATRKAKNFLNVFLTANQLDVAEDRTFMIAKTFDFFAAGDYLFARNKAAFESVMSYRALYAESFAQLTQNNSFTQLFSELQPLVDHVGTNAMHLRRMEVVRQRGYFADAAYVQRIREVNAQRGWNIQFDGQGRIVPTANTVRTIIQVLLNHRLFSELSLDQFDVPNATPVG